MSSKLNRIIERSTQLGADIQSLQRPRPSSEGAAAAGAWHPRFEVYHHQDHLFIDVELPGVPPEAFTVETHPDMVVVRGEKPDLAELRDREEIASTREYGDFSVQFAVPAGYGASQLDQRLVHGVLHLKLGIVPRPSLPDAR